MTQIKFHTRYSPPPKVVFKTTGVSRTKQQFAEDADINNIVKKYIASGYDHHHIKKKQSFFADFAADVSLDSAYKAIQVAEEEFIQLPAAVRDEFGNDPELFFKAVSTEEGIKKHSDLFIKSGIMTKADKDELSPSAEPPSKAQAVVDNSNPSPPPTDDSE